MQFRYYSTRPGDLFQHRTAIGSQDMPYRIHTSAGRWSGAAGSHGRNRVQPGIYDQRQASILPQRQNEKHRGPQRSTAATAVRIDGNNHFTAWIARHFPPTALRAGSSSQFWQNGENVPRRDGARRRTIHFLLVRDTKKSAEWKNAASTPWTEYYWIGVKHGLTRHRHMRAKSRNPRFAMLIRTKSSRETPCGVPLSHPNGILAFLKFQLNQ